MRTLGQGYVRPDSLDKNSLGGGISIRDYNRMQYSLYTPSTLHPPSPLHHVARQPFNPPHNSSFVGFLNEVLEQLQATTLAFTR